MSRLRVLFLTEGRDRRGLSPAARYRVHQYIPHLRRIGIECVVSPSAPPKYYALQAWHRWAGARSRTFSRLSHLLGPAAMVPGRSLDLARATTADVVVFQRDLLPTYPPFLELAFASIAPTVFDIDDAVHLRPPGTTPLARLTHDPQKIPRIMRHASMTLAGSQALLSYAVQHTQEAVYLPTTVDTDRYRPTEDHGSELPTVLWTGTSSNLPQLEALGPVLARLSRSRAFVLRVICDQPPHLPADLTVDHRPWRLDRELHDLEGASVGLMPLEDTEWNRAKCAMKLLIYGALGLPSVASPVGANVEVLRPGTGLLASTPTDWFDALDRLLRDSEARREMGRAARINVRDQWSTEVWAPRLAEYLRRAA